jgi:2-oxoglutarate dehydrogenase E1 component
MTPKGYLRAPAVASARDELLQGRFRTVIGDDIAPEAVRRVLVCSGKIAHELRAERIKRAEQRAAIVTLEQFYPFPDAELGQEIGRYRNAEQVVWVQEEPANSGGLSFVRPLLQRLAGSGHVTSVKRSASASPATGSTKAHALEQSTLLELAFASFD